VTGRHVTTAVTLLVLLGILAVGGLVGVRTLLAPVPDSGTPTASASPSCATRTVRKGQRIRARQVEVSVFNGGTRFGLAGKVMSRFARRGFKRGQVGNAPSGTRIKVVQVWTTDRNDTGARLVARQLGRSVRVRVVRADLGPGVDVVVGNGFKHLVRAPRVMVAARSSSVCSPFVSSSPVR
jgi:LytR cell envelope-related transcriptional attenuator